MDEKTATAYHRFMRESLYWEMLDMIHKFQRHPWSKRQPRRDADAIDKMIKYLWHVTGDLYLIRQAMQDNKRDEKARAALAKAKAVGGDR